MSKEKIFHPAPAIIATGRTPAQFVVVNVDGIDKMVPLPRALNFLNNRSIDRTENLSAEFAALRKQVEDTLGKLKGVYKVKGDVFNLDYLPESPELGDCYNVLHSFELNEQHYSAGTNIVWDGKKWDTLGGKVEVDESMQQQILELLNPKLEALAEEAVGKVLNWYTP